MERVFISPDLMSAGRMFAGQHPAALERTACHHCWLLGNHKVACIVHRGQRTTESERHLSLLSVHASLNIHSRIVLYQFVLSVFDLVSAG